MKYFLFPILGRRAVRGGCDGGTKEGNCFLCLMVWISTAQARALKSFTLWDWEMMKVFFHNYIYVFCKCYCSSLKGTFWSEASLKLSYRLKSKGILRESSVGFLQGSRYELINVFAYYQLPLTFTVIQTLIRASLHLTHTSFFLLTQLNATSRKDEGEYFAY